MRGVRLETRDEMHVHGRMQSNHIHVPVLQNDCSLVGTGRLFRDQKTVQSV